MKLKLIDMKQSDPQAVQTGTCELCFGTTTATEPVFIFQEVETQKVHTVDGYYWNWGDYRQVWVDNVIDFAAFVAAYDFDEEDCFNYYWLDGLVDEYDRNQEVTVDESI